MSTPRPGTDPRSARLARAERLLDRWLARAEGQFDDPGDPLKVAELVHAFTMIKRIREIEALERKLADGVTGDHDPAIGFALDPDVS